MSLYEGGSTRVGYLIDNNAEEWSLKRVRIGRKYWLFASNYRDGGTAGLLYSLIASAERHGPDPQRYVKGVFSRHSGLAVERTRQAPARTLEALSRSQPTSHD